MSGETRADEPEATVKAGPTRPDGDDTPPDDSRATDAATDDADAKGEPAADAKGEPAAGAEADEADAVADRAEDGDGARAESAADESADAGDDPAADADDPDDDAHDADDDADDADEESDDPADDADEDADESDDPADDADDDADDADPRPGGSAETSTVVRTPPDPADAARRRLRRALAPRATRSQLLAAVVCALLGFAVVVQTRQAQVQSVSSLRESDLVAVLDNVTQQSARLEDQARSLQQTLDGLQTSSDRAPAARQAAQERLQVLGVLAGTLPATGPGIELEVPDPKLAVNATEMLETVQELRDAGAEAMQLGPVRVVASTALVDTGAGLLVDQTVVAPPYRLLAIGDPQTLSAALEIPGGVLEVLRGKGVVGVVRTRESLTVAALRSPRAPQYARPAPSAP